MATPTLEEIEARRAQKRDETEAKRLAQHTIDMAAYADLEDQFGASYVARLAVPYAPGMVTFAVCKAPSDAHVKRYKERCKPRAGKDVDFYAAADEIAASCRIYPVAPDEYKALCDARPGIHTRLGLEALKLAGLVEQEESKS